MNAHCLILSIMSVFFIAISAPINVKPYVPSDSVPSDTLPDNPFNSDVFSFTANATPLRNVLKLFAATNGLKLVADSLPDKIISVAFTSESFEHAMDKMLLDCNCKWHISSKTLFITAIDSADVSETTDRPAHRPVEITTLSGARIFKIDYPRLKRSGTGSSTATISSAASGEAGSIALSTTDDILFWQELEDQLRELISPAGKLVISKMAGIVHVSDSTERLDEIAAYIKSVVEVATRQVEITARIYEVSLDSDHSLGIDWNLVSQSINRRGYTGTYNGNSEVVRKSPDLKVATAGVNLSIDGKIDVIVDALKEQGNVEAVSQPRILTLNNQPALIKIGTDYPFFSANVTTNATTNQREVQEEVRVITVGVILSVTPQISGDGWVTLGIDPLISDLVSTEQSENGSTAPVIDVKQSSALVRLHDRTTVRISGLLQKKKRTLQRKVPLLGDVPILKYLFSWSYTKETQRELIIFITPRCL